MLASGSASAGVSVNSSPDDRGVVVFISAFKSITEKSVYSRSKYWAGVRSALTSAVMIWSERLLALHRYWAQMCASGHAPAFRLS